jgi:hypothetical protein
VRSVGYQRSPGGADPPPVSATPAEAVPLPALAPASAPVAALWPLSGSPEMRLTALAAAGELWS